MRLSVVVPTHDTRELTGRCLSSLAPLAQSGAEVVLVDDGSRDGTADAVRARFPWARVLTHESARGFAASANHGLAEAGGEVLLLLNSDTEVAAAEVPRMLEAFDADPRLGAAGASLVNPDGSAQWSGGAAPTRRWLVALASGFPRALAAVPGYRRARPPSGTGTGEVEWVTGAALAIRRQAWSETGPLDETYRFYAQDLDFCLRLRDGGWHVRVLPAWRVMHHGGATIGSRAGAAAGAHPGLLWADLLEWGRRRHGMAWASRTASLMRAAAGTRLAVRSVLRPFRPRAERAGWDRETEALRQARAGLAGPPPVS